MKERLPPLQGLYYFYVAADTGSFKQAAERLFVTAAAVSQQIRLLESWLDCDLFIRQHRRVELTPEGQTLYQSANRGFSELQDGIRKLNKDPNPSRLAISTLPSFAQHWLIPRIQRFRTLHPEFSLLIDPKNERVDFKDGLIDICVRYGAGHYDNIESIWLMDETLYAVCHPSYQQTHNIYCIKDLEKAELIEDVWPDMSWELWLATVGMPLTQPSIQYDGSQFVLEGALAAQGVALVKHSLVYRYLLEKKLVRIGKTAVRSNYSYYLCAPKGYFRREKIQLFADWLKQEIATFQATQCSTFNLVEPKKTTG